MVLTCQHTPTIDYNILSPAKTCDTLYYELYELTCNRRTDSCQVRFVKTGSLDITIKDTHYLCMPYIRLASSPAMVNSVVPITYNFPSILEEPLSEDTDDAIYQVLRLIHFSPPHLKPSPADFRNALFHVFCEKLSVDWTLGGIPEAPVIHILDVFNRTLWHMPTCHPNPARLVLMSKLSKGMPKITHPQDIKQCSECLITKLRKAT